MTIKPHIDNTYNYKKQNIIIIESVLPFVAEEMLLDTL